MEKKVEVFNPNKATLKNLVKEIGVIKINGIKDAENYKKAKEFKRDIGKFIKRVKDCGLKKRRSLIDEQKKIIVDEKELIEIVEPKRIEINEEIERIDLERKRKEREILLPARRGMVDSVGRSMLSDEDILNMDEEEFADLYGSSKKIYDEQQAKEKLEKEQAEAREKEIEEAKEQAKIVERERREKFEAKRKKEAEDKQKEEIEKFKREQAEEIIRIKQEKIDAVEKVEQEARQKVIDAKKKKDDEALAIKHQEERDKKNKLYLDFLEKNNCSLKNSELFIIKKIERVLENGNEVVEFHLFKKADILTIKK